MKCDLDNNNYYNIFKSVFNMDWKIYKCLKKYLIWKLYIQTSELFFLQKKLVRGCGCLQLLEFFLRPIFRLVSALWDWIAIVFPLRRLDCFEFDKSEEKKCINYTLIIICGSHITKFGFLEIYSKEGSSIPTNSFYKNKKFQIMKLFTNYSFSSTKNI